MRVKLCFLVATWLLRFGKACMNNTEYFGTLDSSLEISAGSTLISSATSCNCCGLCHQNAACKSFSFGIDSKECVLYNKVGSYSTFSRERKYNDNTQFFFMPYSSLTNEFCRSDSDCVTAGDFCRGRICTTDTTVTCRDVFDQNNALPDHRYWGFIDGRELRLYCRMENDFGGATLLLASHHPATDGVLWSPENVLNKTYEKDNYPNEWTDYSILGYADIIRDSLDRQNYVTFIIAYEHEGSPLAWQAYTAPKTLSLISYDIVPFKNGAFEATPAINWDDDYLAFPHLKNIANCPTLYSTLNWDCTSSDWRSLVRSSDAPWWPLNEPRATVVVYIRE